MKKLKNFMGLSALAASTAILLLPGGVFAQTGDIKEFAYTGGKQVYTVPDGVTRVKIEAYGAAGGNNEHPGGLGGYAGGDLTVTPGEQLYIFAGGKGADCAWGGSGGGYNGGGNAGIYNCSGGGGGGTDVRVGGEGIGDRILVAGGGGGGGQSSPGGAGGMDYGGNTLSGLYQGRANPSDGGGGGGGYYGGSFGYFPGNPTVVYYGDLGGFGGTSYTGGVENGETKNGVRTGNGEVDITILKQDVDPPVTTATLTSDSPVTNDWYSSPVILTLSAKDEGADVAKTEYKINDGDWIAYNAPVTFNEDGKYSVEYRSIDTLGNTEQPKTETIQIDQTAPTISVSLDKTELWAPNHKLVTVNANVEADDSLSGVAKTELVSITSSDSNTAADDIQNANFGTFDKSFDLRAERSGKAKEGKVYTITYQVTDVAGHVSKQSASVTVPHDQGK
ncbi:OmpL47-type beta-barrel domain-containing protein [Bacillus sp. UNC438CL73TsuS30]|uniref:OmpL47-type beta-barrel domain-containing protein n=1 Tax=Bacillus sp. UNC438CL73TsuS30 TaxID=1340434 RepID=UPI000A63B3DB|nr:glycine-rich protein [Bacillus sp. UNC438CL73TsuS30]